LCVHLPRRRLAPPPLLLRRSSISLLPRRRLAPPPLLRFSSGCSISRSAPLLRAPSSSFQRTPLGARSFARPHFGSCGFGCGERYASSECVEARAKRRVLGRAPRVLGRACIKLSKLSGGLVGSGGLLRSYHSKKLPARGLSRDATQEIEPSLHAIARQPRARHQPLRWTKQLFGRHSQSPGFKNNSRLPPFFHRLGTVPPKARTENGAAE
jgi:hypothetical protein